MKISKLEEFFTDAEFIEMCECLQRADHVPGQFKQRAAIYLREEIVGKGLSKTVMRQLLAKARKMRRSTRKDQRQQGSQLAKDIRWYFNLHGD
jgi:hypothetical protein